MSIFKFKHFSIQQSKAALKVGTDAMLLGSFCQWENPKRILDIGTGTGVLALMCAQRFESDYILGIDIDDDSIIDAQLNAKNSPFKSHIEIQKHDLVQLENVEQFDAIISNPPYFENSLVNEEKNKANARHTISLSFEDLLISTSKLLTENGTAWFIIPFQSKSKFISLAANFGLFPQTEITINGKPESPVRSILAFSKTKVEHNETVFTVRNGDGSYTSGYKQLTKEFHDREL